MAKRRVSNLLALAVLATIAERPSHPYEISTKLRTRGKESSIKINFGSLYSVVESLARHGLIEAQETVKDGKRPERTIYAITESGRAEMEDWLAELLSTPKKEYTSFEAALSLAAGIAPDALSSLLTNRASRLRMELGSIDAGLAFTEEMGLPELFVIEEQYRKAVLCAELAFVTDLVARIDADELGGIGWWRKIHALQAQGHSFEEIANDPVKYLGEEAAGLGPLLNS